MQQKPIPVFARYVCPTCNGEGVAEVGQKLLCQNCVNDFLAKNVGMMIPVAETEEVQAESEE